MQKGEGTHGVIATTQSHTADRWHSQAVNPNCLTTEPSLITSGAGTLDRLPFRCPFTSVLRKNDKPSSGARCEGASCMDCCCPQRHFSPRLSQASQHFAKLETEAHQAAPPHQSGTCIY